MDPNAQADDWDPKFKPTEVLAKLKEPDMNTYNHSWNTVNGGDPTSAFW